MRINYPDKPMKAPECSRIIISLTACFLLMFSDSCLSSRENPGKISAKGEFETGLDFRKFLDPPAEFRSYPFYSINDKLEPGEISRQVNEFREAGFGGFYLHSREGLLTEYLGDEWWKAMDAAVKTAGNAGLHACFYDEDKWPSGYAGGIIPLLNEEYRAKCLARIRKGTPLPAGGRLLKEEDSVLFISYTAPLGNPIFNGTCYVDLFNQDMVRDFIRISYKPYIERYKAIIPENSFEIFSDEPHIHARYFDRNTPSDGILSWSPRIAERFREIWGYDILEKVNLLFEERDDWRQVRLHYYIALARQFEESFTRQIARFCGDNGVRFTGHYLGEESLEKVRDRIGNAMLHYRNMQQPGIDALGLSISGRLITVKSLSGVANQYDIPKRLCEIYGISGQNMNFEDRKWLAGWQTVLGVNHLVPHLALYSLKGIRKRDYPPTFSDHQPWWPYNKKIEDYTGRISYAATTGRYHPQILVINPLESEYLKSDTEPGFSDGVLLLMQKLQESHYDYDLGDEQILADIARLKGDRLIVGTMSYQAVILPDMIEIRKTTADLLLKLTEKGGIVISAGRFPRFIDGKPDSERLNSLEKKAIKLDTREIRDLIPAVLKPNVTVNGMGADKIWSCVRVVENGSMILLNNISHTEALKIRLKSDLAGSHPVLWDPSAAECYETEPEINGEFILELAPSCCIWLTSGSLSKNARITGKYKIPSKKETLITLPQTWHGKRLSPNAMTLDFACWSTDGGTTYSNPEPVIGIFQRLNDTGYKGPLSLHFNVEVEEVPAKAQLVVEQPEMYSLVEVNSHEVHFGGSDYYLDRRFLSSEVGNLLQKGENSILLKLDFLPANPVSKIQKERYGTEIESIYLTGDFAVKGYGMKTVSNSQRNDSPDMVKKPVYQFGSFAITGEENEFTGNLTNEGYPFYAGSFELTSSFKVEKVSGMHYFLSFPGIESIVTIPEVNGRVVDTIVWSPCSAEVTDFIRNGTNEVRITMVNSLRNLLGPHHHPRGELIRVGPDSFTGSGGFPEPSGDKNWYDLRKTKPALKLWNDTYHLIPFGLLEPPVITVSFTSE